jgi:cytochrome c oxidase assembly protein subunit 15
MTEIKKNARYLAIWLFFCAFMVMAMTGIGAVTRLTESGLSITEWNVVSGTLPPLNEEAWLVEFDKYKASPEYIHKNAGMSLEEFKGIFFWEWFHRLWGRVIGITFAGIIPKEDRLKYLGLLVLGGGQGALGWFMVKSGLVDRPSVSHFRLAAHLSLALTIFSALLWMGLRQLDLAKLSITTSLRTHGIFALICVAVTIVWGAFVAGLDAGMIYNTFPLMGDGIAPTELGNTPFLYDPASIQFTHRMLAMFTGFVVFAYGLRFSQHHKSIGYAIAAWVWVQVGLGITTLLTVVNIHVATTHQLGAIVLLSLLIVSLYRGMPERRAISS